MIAQADFEKLKNGLSQKGVTLVAVSKTKPAEDILALYNLGQRDFGENYVQELMEKKDLLPPDIRWHFIGHLQSNKVKYILPFVHLVHGVDSEKLLTEIDRQSKKKGTKANVLLQAFIAQEETKFGMDESEIDEVMRARHRFENVTIRGLMGMASFSMDAEQIRKEFKGLRAVFNKYPSFETLSMGMTSDYETALQEGSTLVRLGSLLFGGRT